MGKAVIVDYVRSPFAKADDPGNPKGKPGKLADMLPTEMMANLAKELLQRTGADANDIESSVIGAVHQEAEQGLNIGRLIALHPDANLPISVQGDTLDKFCASSMRALAIAKNDVMAGEAKMVLVGGVQSMSRIPMGGWNIMMDPQIADGNAAAFMNMGVTAENLAERNNIPRELQDRFAVASHQKAADANAKGFLKDEIITMNGLDHDDAVRPDSNVESLAKLKPVFKNEDKGGSVTAATSSPYTDGAAAMLVADADYAKEKELPVLANIVAYAGAGCAPETMGLGPVPAIKKLIERAKVELNDPDFSLDDVDVIELNEAFAAQSIAVLQDLGIDVEKELDMNNPDRRVNIDGGAIAVGHPLGASGARIVGHAANVLKRLNKRFAIASMCVGGGQGTAMLLENPNYKPPQP